MLPIRTTSSGQKGLFVPFDNTGKRVDVAKVKGQQLIGKKADLGTRAS
jgi:hypothetical protein